MNRLLLAVILLGSAAFQRAPAVPSPSDVFFERLRALCGQNFQGRLASPPTAADAAFAGPITVRVQDCTADQVRMPLMVGADRSRTWVVTRTAQGLTLKHDHRHADGTEDTVSQYGGATVAPGTAARPEFPAGAFSKALFEREKLTASLTNVWALEIQPGATLAYELNRPGRHFRIAFDLTRPAPRDGGLP